MDDIGRQTEERTDGDGASKSDAVEGEEGDVPPGEEAGVCESQLVREAH